MYITMNVKMGVAMTSVHNPVPASIQDGAETGTGSGWESEEHEAGLVVDLERLERIPVETPTVTLRRTWAGPLTAPVYAALHGCTLATARQILAGERLPPWLTARTRCAERPDAFDDAPVLSQERLAPLRARAPQRSPAQENGAPQPRDSNSSESMAAGMADAVDLAEARRVVAAVCAVWNTNAEDLAGPSRARPIVPPRQTAMALIAGRCPRLSLPAIGRLFGRDHSTVIYALHTHRRRIRREAAYARATSVVIERLAASAMDSTECRD
jgi:hypothetical protein